MYGRLVLEKRVKWEIASDNNETSYIVNSKGLLKSIFPMIWGENQILVVKGFFYNAFCEKSKVMSAAIAERVF